MTNSQISNNKLELSQSQSRNVKPMTLDKNGPPLKNMSMLNTYETNESKEDKILAVA
jgi:hypothetical protein